MLLPINISDFGIFIIKAVLCALLSFNRTSIFNLNSPGLPGGLVYWFFHIVLPVDRRMVGFFFDIQDPVHIVLLAYILDQVGIGSDVHALVPGDSGVAFCNPVPGDIGAASCIPVQGNIDVASCIPVPGNVGMVSCIPVLGNVGMASCIPVLGSNSLAVFSPMVVSWPPFDPTLSGGS